MFEPTHFRPILSPSKKLNLPRLDLADFPFVTSIAERFQQGCDHLDILLTGAETVAMRYEEIVYGVDG